MAGLRRRSDEEDDGKKTTGRMWISGAVESPTSVL
jgi:hypothetical protein